MLIIIYDTIPVSDPSDQSDRFTLQWSKNTTYVADTALSQKENNTMHYQTTNHKHIQIMIDIETISRNDDDYRTDIS